MFSDEKKTPQKIKYCQYATFHRDVYCSYLAWDMSMISGTIYFCALLLQKNFVVCLFFTITKYGPTWLKKRLNEIFSQKNTKQNKRIIHKTTH